MMRVTTFIFIALFSISARSQTDLARRAFDEGTVLAAAGQYESALGNFQKAKLSAESEKTGAEFEARVHFNIGVCLYRMGRTDEAVAEFERAVALGRGKYQKAFYALGMAEAERGNRRRAIEAFRRAVRLKKSDAEAWFDLGLALVEEKDFRAAREAFENSIRYRSSSLADAHNNVGVIFALGGDLASAEKRFEAALVESNGKSVEAKNNLEFCRLYKQNALKTGEFRFSRNGG